jgi:hypothetical protein
MAEAGGVHDVRVDLDDARIGGVRGEAARRCNHDHGHGAQREQDILLHDHPP